MVVSRWRRYEVSIHVIESKTFCNSIKSIKNALFHFIANGNSRALWRAHHSGSVKRYSTLFIRTLIPVDQVGHTMIWYGVACLSRSAARCHFIWRSLCLTWHITLLIHMAFPVCDVVQHVVEIMQFKCNVSLQLKPADAVIFAVAYVWLIIFSNLLKKLEMVSW